MQLIAISKAHETKCNSMHFLTEGFCSWANQWNSMPPNQDMCDGTQDSRCYQSTCQRKLVHVPHLIRSPPFAKFTQFTQITCRHSCHHMSKRTNIPRRPITGFVCFLVRVMLCIQIFCKEFGLCLHWIWICGGLIQSAIAGAGGW